MKNVALILLLTAVVGGCCSLHGTCKEGSVGFCATEEVKAQVPHLLPVLADLVMHGSGDLVQQLEQLAITLGKDGLDVLTCAMTSLYAQTGSQLYSSAGQPTYHETPEVLARGHDRTGAWLKARGKL